MGTFIEFRGPTRKWDYPLVHTTMVTNIKANGKVKSRLWLRGDRIAQINKQFSSAPTVPKEPIRIFSCVFVNHQSFAWAQWDISKAFAHSDMLHDSDKMIAILPNSIMSDGLPWESWVATSSDGKEVGGLWSDPKNTMMAPKLITKKPG